MSGPRPFILGLTGSIGMGKSTTAGFFTELGIPVWDADAAVHRLYAKGGAAVSAIGAICPSAVVDGAVERGALRDWIATDDGAIKKIEKIVHPLVALDRQDFFDTTEQKLVVVDVPLLFETGGDAYVDATLVVSAPAGLQKARVLERPGMTEAHFTRILSSQMPDEEKRKRADFIVETTSLELARQSVLEVLKELKPRIANHA